MKKQISFSIILNILFFSQLFAQQYVNPHFNTYRMDYRDLGYPNQNLIPADNARITALLSHSNGMIYGATTGKTQSYLFFFTVAFSSARLLSKVKFISVLD